MKRFLLSLLALFLVSGCFQTTLTLEPTYDFLRVLDIEPEGEDDITDFEMYKHYLEEDDHFKYFLDVVNYGMTLYQAWNTEDYPEGRLVSLAEKVESYSDKYYKSQVSFDDSIDYTQKGIGFVTSMDNFQSNLVQSFRATAKHLIDDSNGKSKYMYYAFTTSEGFESEIENLRKFVSDYYFYLGFKMEDDEEVLQSLIDEGYIED